MRIEYEADVADHVDYLLACAAPPPQSRRDRRKAGHLPAWVPWVVLVAPLSVAIVFAIQTNGRWGIHVEDVWGGVLDTVGQYEWLLPWVIWLIVSVSVIPAMRHGLRRYRVATATLAIGFLATAALVVATNAYASKPPLLRAMFGRWLPWFFVGVKVLSPLRQAWWRPDEEAFDTASFVTARRAVTFEDYFVLVESEAIDVCYRWSALARWAVTDRLVLLYDARNVIAIWFPKRAVGDATLLKQLTDAIESRLDPNRAFAIDTPSDERRSPFTPG